MNAQPTIEVDYVGLVMRILNDCYDGKLPPCSDVQLAEAIMAGLYAKVLVGASEPALTAFAEGLLRGIRAVHAAAICRWRN